MKLKAKKKRKLADSNSIIYFILCNIEYTIQYNAIQYSAIQYNAIQYSAIQYNAIQYEKYNIITMGTYVFTMDCVSFFIFGHLHV
jgi:hypothetical protein